MKLASSMVRPVMDQKRYQHLTRYRIGSTHDGGLQNKMTGQVT